jgi:hypothetical protein
MKNDMREVLTEGDPGVGGSWQGSLHATMGAFKLLLHDLHIPLLTEHFFTLRMLQYTKILERS